MLMVTWGKMDGFEKSWLSLQTYLNPNHGRSFEPRQRSSAQSTKGSNLDGFSVLPARKVGSQVKGASTWRRQKTRQDFGPWWTGLMTVDLKEVHKNPVISSIFQTNSKNTEYFQWVKHNRWTNSWNYFEAFLSHSFIIPLHLPHRVMFSLDFISFCAPVCYHHFISNYAKVDQLDNPNSKK